MRNVGSAPMTCPSSCSIPCIADPHGPPIQEPNDRRSRNRGIAERLAFAEARAKFLSCFAQSWRVRHKAEVGLASPKAYSRPAFALRSSEKESSITLGHSNGSQSYNVGLDINGRSRLGREQFVRRGEAACRPDFPRALHGSAVLCRLPRPRSEESRTGPRQPQLRRRDPTPGCLGTRGPKTSCTADAADGEGSAGRAHL